MPRLEQAIPIFFIIFLFLFPVYTASGKTDTCYIITGNKGPEIKDIIYTPLYPTINDKLNVSATVTDSDGLTTVEFFCCTNTSCIMPISFESLGNDRYWVQLDLSIFSVGEQIGFNITASDKLGNTNATNEYYLTILRVPNSLTVTTKLDRRMCPPGEKLVLNGSAEYDSGAPAVDANVTISIPKTGLRWTTHVNVTGKFGLNITAPMKEGIYRVFSNVSIKNLTGSNMNYINVTLKPMAPDFKFTDIDGKQFSLVDYRDKVILLDFMSLSCIGCKDVEYNLLDIYPNYKSKAVVFISVDILDTDSNDALKQHRTDNGISWIITKAPSGLVDAYSISNIPVVIIINKDGYITFDSRQNLNAFNKNDISNAIDSTLAGTTPIDLVFVAFAGMAIFMGIAAFFSPCSFPLLPGYVSFYIGMNKGALGKNKKKRESSANRKKRRRGSFAFALKGGLASGLGLITIFLIVGLMTIPLGGLLVQNTTYLELVMAIILIFLGALMLTNIQYYFIINPIKSGIARIKGVFKGKKKDSKNSGAESISVAKPSVLSLFGYGMGYGAAALGCTLPVFIAVIAGGIASGGIINGFVILLLFSLTAALLMVAITLLVAGFEMAVVNKLKIATPYIKKISGFVLMLAGLYLLCSYFYATNTGFKHRIDDILAIHNFWVYIVIIVVVLVCILIIASLIRKVKKYKMDRNNNDDKNSEG